MDLSKIKNKGNNSVDTGKESSASPFIPKSSHHSLTIRRNRDNTTETSLDYSPPKKCCTGTRCKSIKSNKLSILIVFGVFSGITVGSCLRYQHHAPWTAREALTIGFVGELFIRILQCIVIPLIVSSLISAVANMDTTMSSKMGFRALCYYFTTTICAVILGIVLVTSIKPGYGSDLSTNESDDVHIATRPASIMVMDLVRNLFPDNIIRSTIQSHRTVLVTPDNHVNSTNTTGQEEIKGEYVENTNVLGLVMFSITFGVALTKLGKKGKILLDVFTALSDAMMMITSWIIWMSPLGIFSLIASMLVQMEDLTVLMGQIGMLLLTEMCGYFIHGFIILPLMFTIMMRRSPIPFLLKMTEAYMTAFGTSSSSAAMPVTLRCLETKVGVNPLVSRFIVPIGTTINMDGTALYEGIAVVFVAQALGKPMTWGFIIAISITATAASVGAAAIPHAALVTMVMVLEAVGLPTKAVAIIFAVDWIFDRFRTMINVMGDSVGAAIVDHLSKDDLELMDPEQKVIGDRSQDIQVIIETERSESDK